jgi:hypothetical protein
MFVDEMNLVGIKEIVSRDRDWPEWVLNERSKELMIAGSYF